MSLSAFLYIAAFILFVLGAISVPSGRVNLVAAGLACLSAAALFGSGGGLSFGN